MGILILFVLAVGAGTIVYFIWKFVTGIWNDLFEPETVKRHMEENAARRARIAADGYAGHKPRFSGGRWRYNGTSLF